MSPSPTSTGRKQDEEKARAELETQVDLFASAVIAARIAGHANDRHWNGTSSMIRAEAHLPHYGATVGEVAEELEAEERACHRWLAAAKVYVSEREVDFKGETRAGHPAQELVRAAEQHRADLIVVGHSGHSSVWGRFLGSTAEKTAVTRPARY